jgi:hypothetical protein
MKGTLLLVRRGIRELVCPWTCAMRAEIIKELVLVY